jgi:hypothetical protein
VVPVVALEQELTQVLLTRGLEPQILAVAVVVERNQPQAKRVLVVLVSLF